LIGAKNVQTYAILANFQMEEMEEQMLDGIFFAKIQTQCLISKQKLFNISQHSYGGTGEQMLDRSKKLANIQTQCLISKQSFISKQNLCNISQYSNGEEWGEQMLDRQRTCRMVISQHSNS